MPKRIRAVQFAVRALNKTEFWVRVMLIRKIDGASWEEGLTAMRLAVILGGSWQWRNGG